MYVVVVVVIIGRNQQRKVERNFSAILLSYIETKAFVHQLSVLCKLLSINYQPLSPLSLLSLSSLSPTGHHSPKPLFFVTVLVF